MDYGGHVGVSQGPEDLVGIVPHGEGPGGAVGHTLAAEGAVGIFQTAVVGDIHRGPSAGARHIPDLHALDLVAYLHAAHAFDTLAGLTDHRHVQVHPGAFRLHLIGLVMDVQIVGELLQLTVAAAHADGTVGIVLGEDQAKVGLAGLPHPGAVGADDHAVHHLGVAGGHQALGVLDLHHAHAAGGDLVEFLQIAQVGDRDAGVLGGLQDGVSFRHAQFAVVNFDGYHFSTRPPLKIPYPKWSQRRHREDSFKASSQVMPHSMHWKSFLRSLASRSLEVIRPRERRSV